VSGEVVSCPHCGTPIDEEPYHLFDEVVFDETDFDCDHCGKMFTIFRSVTYYGRIKTPTPPKHGRDE